MYERLALLLEAEHSAVLKALIVNVQAERQQRLNEAWRMLADLLVDVSAWRLVSSSDAQAMAESTQQMHTQIRQREAQCVTALLKRFNFSSRDYLADELQFDGEQWETDLFNPEILKDLGVHVGKGVAAGALAGATVDMLTLGFSLGSGTVIGAAAGGLWQGFDKWGQRLLGKWRGKMELSVHESVIRVMALRQTALIQALEARGHAAQVPIAIARSSLMLGKEMPEDSSDDKRGIDWRSAPLPAMLVEARHHPEWCLFLGHYGTSARREQVVIELTSLLSQAESREELPNA